VLAQINAVHATVTGVVPETGRRYTALDPDLLLWVHETLIDSALRIYDRFVAPISAEEAEAYHAEGCEIAVRLGVPPDRVPPTLAELRADMRRRLESGEVAVSPTALALRDGVLYPTRFPPGWVWWLAHLPSFSILPPAIRRGYGIGWGGSHDVAVRTLAAASRRLLPLVPDPLRYVPHARDAERRAAWPPLGEARSPSGIISPPAP
jgi:uncharacterized protein (DUF2236 family)